MADINRFALAKRLEPGLAAGLITSAGDGVFSYEFSHELVRLAFLDRLDTVRLAELNLAAAKLREQVPDDELPARAGTLAHHHELAAPLVGDKPAIEYQILAGEFANSRLASPEARFHLEKAV
jgi:predicted ATPase